MASTIPGAAASRKSAAVANCVLMGYVADKEHLTWCGRQVTRMEWRFKDATHALLAMLPGPTSMGVCSACKKEMMRVLRDDK